MAKKTNGDRALDALSELVARFPWWVGVLLAIVLYVWLHGVATSQPPQANGVGQLSGIVTQSLWIGLAGVGQYLIPFVCLIGAGMSWYRRRRAQQLHHDALQRSDGIAQMGWRDFEVLVAEHFRRQGFSATETGGGGADGGVDVVVRRGTDRYLVQCKHWRARRVGVEPVRELYGLIAAQRLAGGYVVTSGDFTEQARAFAHGREIQLINGQALQRSLRATATPVGAAMQTPEQQDHAFAQTQPMAFTSSAKPPRCPACGAAMVLRQARTGANAGNTFWGCGQFAKTRCRGTRPV